MLARKQLRRRIYKNPELKFLIMYAIAGHGMLWQNGQQVVLINTFNKKTGFYHVWQVEAEVRTLARDFSNTYQTVLFACCREIFDPDTHSGLKEGPMEKAVAQFTELAMSDFKLQTSLSMEDKYESLK